jgi:hypothetical protein
VVSLEQSVSDQAGANRHFISNDKGGEKVGTTRVSSGFARSQEHGKHATTWMALYHPIAIINVQGVASISVGQGSADWRDPLAAYQDSSFGSSKVFGGK